MESEYFFESDDKKIVDVGKWLSKVYNYYLNKGFTPIILNHILFNILQIIYFGCTFIFLNVCIDYDVLLYSNDTGSNINKCSLSDSNKMLEVSKWLIFILVLLGIKLVWEIIQLVIIIKDNWEIREFYNLVIFRKPKYHNYNDVNMDSTCNKLKATYYTLDLFSYTDYDRIVFLDMDMIVFDDISELFKCNAK